MSNEKDLLDLYYEQEMESLEMPAGLASGVIMAIEASERIREARLMTASVVAITIAAIVLSVTYFNLETLVVVAAIILGVFAYFFAAAEIRQKQALYA